MNHRKVWLVLLIILGFSLPIAVEAMPGGGGESSEDTHHGSRMRSRERVISRALAWPAVHVIRLAPVQLPGRVLLERSTRPMTSRSARQIPPLAASSPAGTLDH